LSALQETVKTLKRRHEEDTKMAAKKPRPNPIQLLPDAIRSIDQVTFKQSAIEPLPASTAADHSTLLSLLGPDRKFSVEDDNLDPLFALGGLCDDDNLFFDEDYFDLDNDDGLESNWSRVAPFLQDALVQGMVEQCVSPDLYNQQIRALTVLAAYAADESRSRLAAAGRPADDPQLVTLASAVMQAFIDYFCANPVAAKS
jgi:hypothetical protein